MTRNLSTLALATLALAGTLACTLPASAQVAGATASMSPDGAGAAGQTAMGWSVKKTLLGKTVYNDAGKKVGQVADLIISPAKNVSYVIVGAGGFVGIGSHDVAIPISQIQTGSGKLVLAGATPESIKAMPAFSYAKDTGRREDFVAAADDDIAKGRAKVAELEKKSGSAGSEAKVKMDQQITALKADVQSAQAKLTEMKQASEQRWREYEASVSAATARLRKSIESATG